MIVDSVPPGVRSRRRRATIALADEARTELVEAVNGLPSAISRPLEIALRGGRFQMSAGSWEGGPGGAVCPIVAAAMTAGVWRDGHCAAGGPEWGSEERPSDAVMEFAVCFDLCVEEDGIEAAVAFTRTALGGHRRSTTDKGHVAA
jgi:hypothetical protein